MCYLVMNHCSAQGNIEPLMIPIICSNFHRSWEIGSCYICILEKFCIFVFDPIFTKSFNSRSF